MLKKNIQNENYGVSELSADLSLSRSQLHRKVTGLLGFTPNEIIRNMRLEKAKMFINKKTGTIAEIAYNCGFSSPAYFSKCYKDYFGHTPGEDL
ncbi:MAG: helix-turn-helix transcriptional regulator [Saprospiraceae bacterium]|nr:helix-turn-helix transcriptional regulator [Saprospiraceae bacterium]